MRFILLIVALLIPVQALALSCTPWYVEDAYHRATNAEEAYFVVNGTLSFDASALPEVDFSNQQDTPPETFIDATIAGNLMTLTGFNRFVERPITLVVRCMGPWCADAKNSVPTLAFLKRVDGELLLDADPCTPMLFQNPKQSQIRAVLSCFSGGKCVPDTR